MRISEIHHILSAVRKENSLSQKDIAAMLNVEQATVSLYETGKRGIPLDLLDNWLQILDIEVKVTPKGFKPINPPEEIENDLATFYELRKKRNFLIAELRAAMAVKLMQEPQFAKTNEETEEGRFWPYNYNCEELVGLIETRYDHPDQKYMAVEYTCDEVNVYKFLSADESGDEQSDYEWMNVNRVYFTEDDFLTLSGRWNRDSMEMRKMTILRKSTTHPDGVEIIDPEGFPLRTLVEMMENHLRFSNIVKELERDWKYINRTRELAEIRQQMVDISLRNKLENGKANTEFVFWREEDHNAVEIPLWDTQRTWKWLEEGVEWTEEYSETQEIKVVAE